MGQFFLVVESLGKQKTLQKILNEKATVIYAGPPQSESGDFALNGDANVFPKDLTRLTRQDTVYFATDPNLVGEKIAAAAKDKFPDNVQCRRVLLMSFTPHSVNHALKNAAPLNDKGAKAHELRERLSRLFDRTFRFVLDVPSLNKVLRLETLLLLDFLVQAEITARTSCFESHWTIDVELKGRNSRFWAPLTNVKDQDAIFSDPHSAKACIIDLKKQDFKITSTAPKSKSIQPPPPYVTVTLLRDAARDLGFAPAQTISVARSLYEGVDIGLTSPVSLITFPFTAEYACHHECVQAVREFVLNNYGVDYVSKQQRYKSVSALSVAITPVEIKRTPKKVRKYLTEPQYKLYELVWTKTVSSQMRNAVIKHNAIECSAGPDDRYQFFFEDIKIDFRGFLQVDSHPVSCTSATGENLRKNQPLECLGFRLNKNDTIRTESFTVAKVFDILYHTSLGQPENYADMLSALADCHFITIKDGSVHVTTTGEEACRIMHQQLPHIFSTEFAKGIGKRIDLVLRGRKKSEDVFRQYSNIIDTAIQKIASQKQVCPLCGGKLILRESETSQRVCELYPYQCDYVESITDGNSTQVCDKCGAEMVVRNGRYGRFLACSRFPECHFTKPYTINVKCPSDGCDGDVIERYSATGYLFYGCSKYPACKFASWLKPVNVACPYCGHTYMVEKHQDQDCLLFCPNCKNTMKETITTAQ